MPKFNINDLQFDELDEYLDQYDGQRAYELVKKVTYCFMKFLNFYHNMKRQKISFVI